MTNRERKDKSKSGPWIITITLIAALAVSYYQWNRHTTQTQVYDTVMMSYDPPANNSRTSSNSVLNESIREFDIKNYDASHTLLQSIKPKTDSIYWYLGHIALIKGKVYEAKNHSNKIKHAALKSNLSKYVDQIISK